MRLPKHIMPDDYFSVTPKTDVQITALPFYIKEGSVSGLRHAYSPVSKE